MAPLLFMIASILFQRFKWAVLGVVALWVMVPMPIVAHTVLANIPIDPASVGKVADIAREKDIVWLSIVLAMAAIGATVFCVRKIFQQFQQLVELTRQGYEAVDSLRDELERQRLSHK